MKTQRFALILLSSALLSAPQLTAHAGNNDPCAQAFNNPSVTQAQIKSCKQHLAARIKSQREIANTHGQKIAAAMTYRATQTGNPLQDMSKPLYQEVKYHKHCKLEIKSAHPSSRSVRYKENNAFKLGSPSDAGLRQRFNLLTFEMSEYPFISHPSNQKSEPIEESPPYTPSGHYLGGENFYVGLRKQERQEPALWFAVGNALLPGEATGRSSTQLATLKNQRRVIAKLRISEISTSWGLALYHCDQTLKAIAQFERAKTLTPNVRTAWP